MDTGLHPRARVARASVGAMLVVVVATGCGPIGAGGEAASCAIKEIALVDPHLVPGGEVELSVDWMTERCEDTGGTDRPARDVLVTITPRSTGEPLMLGSLDPASGPLSTASGTVTLPDDMPIGDATLVVASQTGDRSTATRDVRITSD